MKSIRTAAALIVLAVLAACDGAGGVHNLTADEKRRAEIHAAAFYDAEHPGGVDAAGALVKKKGSFQSCRPQDSNSNGLVTCNGMLPDLKGGFVAVTRYCGYEKDGVIGCSDKDQK